MSLFYAFRSSRLWLGAALLCLFTTLAQAQTIRYVKPVATGTGDGSSWANATASLQRTIDRSAPDDQVWVAAGLYKPTRIPPGLDPTDERNKTFFFSNGVKVFGGFDGDETAPDQRDLTVPSSTTLSGDLGKPFFYNPNNIISESPGYGDNAAAVVTIRGSSKTRLDGFLITGEGPGVRPGGGDGLLNDGSSQFNAQTTGSQPLLRNCTFITLAGVSIREISGSIASGGTYINCFVSTLAVSPYGLFCQINAGEICSPTFNNCKFSNTSYALVFDFFDRERGVCLPTLINCSIIDGVNGFVTGRSGKNILDLKLTGCLIANMSRGALLDSQGSGTSGTATYYLENCTVTRNGGFFQTPSSSFPSVTIKNCVICNNGADSYQSSKAALVSYSIVPNEPGLTGKSNLVVDPQFFDGKPNRFQLRPTSPGVNAGDPNTNPKDLPATDLDGNPRIQGRIDIGAYERDVLPNRAPYALTHPDEVATMGIPFLSGGQEAYFVDPEDKPITLTAAGLPANLSLIRNASGSYAISGTPTKTGVSSVTITAKDPDGLTATQTFQLVVDTAPVAFNLIEPTYNCQTGAFTFNTVGGDGSPIEYQAAGITGWSTNPNQFVEVALRTATDIQPLVLLARQKGIVVSGQWDLKKTCGRARIAASEPPEGFSVRVMGNPVVGETAQVAISGADGQPVTLTLTDMQGKTVSTQQISPAGATDTRTIQLGQTGGVYLLRASTGTQSWTVRIVKP